MSVSIHRVSVVGLGTIGMSWTAYFLARGLTVSGFDPDPAAEARTIAFVSDAWESLEHLGLVSERARADLFRFDTNLSDAVQGADFVQENGPESPAAKRSLLAAIDAVVPPTVVIASSTSALPMSGLQDSCRYPGRCVVGHPFNPPHLIPLVEVAGGALTDERCIEEAVAFYAAIGRRPVRLRREIYGHIANRLQYVVFNEAARMVQEGVASPEDIDDAVSWGPGLRWALFGPFMTLHLGGGAAGMQGAFDKFRERDSFNTDRAARTSLPPEVERHLVESVGRAAGERSVDELAAWRDQRLVDILKAKRDAP